LHVLVIVAHSDDEVLGAGAQFASFGALSFIHVTNGAGNIREARAKGFGTLRAYGRARSRELRAAVAAAGLRADFHELGYRALDAGFHMATLTRRLRTMIVRLAPNLVLTQAYEGPHPDHDAVAFAVHHAVRGLTKPPPVWEMTAYHRANGTTVRGSFLPFDGPPIVRAPLDTAARALKRRMLDCFTSQLDVVAQFPLDEEDFRPAPNYDFTRPAHGRPLGYELEGWGMKWELWQALARAARQRLRGGWRDLPANLWLALKLRWAMWSRHAHPDHPRIVRGMQSVRLLSDLGVQQAGGSDSDPA
jgi:N-acetylglucosamine malate deacetylase 2